MKTTRILAALLCVMMVVCALPMMASAAPTAAELNAAGEYLGAASIAPVSGYAFDFAGAGTSYAQPAGVETATNVAYTAEGMKLTNNGTWKFNPSLKWCPFNYGSIYFKAKVQDGESLLHQAYWPVGDQYRVYLNITSTGISATNASNITTHVENFAPGTGFVEYMIQVVDSQQVISAKGGSVDEWTKILTVGTWYKNGYNSGLQFNGSGVVDYCAIFNTSATAAKDLQIFDSAEAALGVSGLVPVDDFQFNANFDKNITGLSSPDSITYNDQGALISNSTLWCYNPGSYYPMSQKAWMFGVKLTSGGTLTVQSTVSAGGRVFVDFSNTGVTVWKGNGSGGFTGATKDFEFVPGTEYFDAMFALNSVGGYNVYVKNQSATGGKWYLLAETDSFRNNSSAGMNFFGGGTGAYVKYSTTLREGGPQYDSIKDIVGSEVVTAQNFVFDKDFVTGLNFIDAQNKKVGIIAPEDASYTDANGLDMSGAASATWTYLPYNGWRPATNNDERTLIAFTAKATSSTDGVIQWKSAGDYKGGYINLNQNSVSCVSSGTTTTYSSIVPGNDWVDYLVVSHTEDTGYELYMKSDSVTNGKWEKKFSTTDGWKHNTNTFNTLGIQIAGKVNMYKNLRLLSTTNAVAESATKPAGAIQLMYEENFNAAPTYANVSAKGTQITDGYANLTSTQEEEGKVVLYNGGIPAGGYAEFKVKNAATSAYYRFYDGAKAYQLEDIKSYGSVPNGNLFISDSGNIWRTFRVVRNTDGTYSAYTKVEDEENWFKLSANVAGTDVAATAQASFAFSAHKNGTDGGAGVIDYLEIYGPAISTPLTITDGYGTKVVADGETITYEESLRYIVNGVSGKLLVVTYQGDNMLKAQIIDAVGGADALVNAKADGATKVKVFLWDSFAKLNRQTPAVTLNF